MIYYLIGLQILNFKQKSGAKLLSTLLHPGLSGRENEERASHVYCVHPFYDTWRLPFRG
jgi:hypothetical protein